MSALSECDSVCLRRSSNVGSVVAWRTFTFDSLSRYGVGSSCSATDELNSCFVYLVSNGRWKPYVFEYGLIQRASVRLIHFRINSSDRSLRNRLNGRGQNRAEVVGKLWHR